MDLTLGLGYVEDASNLSPEVLLPTEEILLNVGITVTITTLHNTLTSESLKSLIDDLTHLVEMLVGLVAETKHLQFTAHNSS